MKPHRQSDIVTRRLGPAGVSRTWSAISRNDNGDAAAIDAVVAAIRKHAPAEAQMKRSAVEVQREGPLVRVRYAEPQVFLSHVEVIRPCCM